MAVADGTPTDITYKSTIAYWPQGAMLRDRCASFNATTSKVAIADAADIQNLVELTLAAWVYPNSAGPTGSGKFLWKGGNLRFECNALSGSKVGLFARIGYSTTHAETNKLAVLDINAWSHLLVTYSQSGDRMVHFFINGTEVTAYDQQQASVGTRNSDVGQTMYLGAAGVATAPYDGLMDTALLYNRVLSASQIKWLAHMEHYRAPGGYLRASAWELNTHVNSDKLSHGAVVFDFEDIYDTVYTAARPIFLANAVPACIAIIVNNIGAGGRLSEAQIKTLRDDGWELISHSLDHGDPLSWTDPQLLAQLVDSKQSLEHMFTCPINSWSWPPSIGYSSQRVTCLKHYKQSVGSSEPAYWVKQASTCWFNLLNQTLSSAKALVDTAYSDNQLLVFGAHEVTAGIPAILTDLLPYINSKPVPILTLDQAFAKMTPKPTGIGPGNPPVPLYNGLSIRLLNTHGTDPQTLFKLVSLAAGHYILWFHAYTDGRAVSAADVVPWAGLDTNDNLATAFQYIRVGPGVYLCCADFALAAPDAWILGVQVPSLVTPLPPFVTYPQWMLYP
jgi:peptidoglycan/xylan/chitin deacetylase (PgdA/CDA1 family)